MTTPISDRRLQVAAGGMALLTVGGAVASGGGDEAISERNGLPPVDHANVRVLPDHPMTIEEGLARHGIIVDTPRSLRMNVLQARAEAAREIAVPRKNLRYGMGKRHGNEDVRALQEVLHKLGFFEHKPNGIYGPRLKKAVKRLQLTLKMMGKPTELNGNFGRLTRRSLTRAFENRNARVALKKAHAQLRASMKYSPGVRYAPHSKKAKRLFRAAAAIAGVPASWAHSRALHNILASESGGVVGIPNYTYGSRKAHKSQWPKIHRELKHGIITAVSSATGLGQLLSYNVKSYYPAGLRGIGVPIQEAAGMLRYIKSRYGSPERAWHLYNTLHEGY